LSAADEAFFEGFSHLYITLYLPPPKSFTLIESHPQLPLKILFYPPKNHKTLLSRLLPKLTAPIFATLARQIKDRWRCTYHPKKKILFKFNILKKIKNCLFKNYPGKNHPKKALFVTKNHRL
jgi:hypothetical protein